MATTPASQGVVRPHGDRLRLDGTTVEVPTNSAAEAVAGQPYNSTGAISHGEPPPGDAPAAPNAQAGEPDENLRSKGDSTSTDFVRSTNGSPAMRSSTRSKCRMSEAKTCTRASASPVTVDAATTS